MGRPRIYSDEDAKKRKAESDKKYREKHREEINAKARRPENRAKTRKNSTKYRKKPLSKLKAKEYREKHREYIIAYRNNPENRKKAKEWRDRPENKKIRDERARMPENKKRRNERARMPERRAKRREYATKYRQDPKNRVGEKASSYRDSIRLKILQNYSKALSNSDVPCCNCCGQKSHVDFLAVDHIAGKKEMDSEPELVKLGYSSKLTSARLRKFILENNFPKGFQILCTNCNFAKGMIKNNNKCPMKGKPH